MEEGQRHPQKRVLGNVVRWTRKALDGHGLTIPIIHTTKDIRDFAQNVCQAYLAGQPITGNLVTRRPLAELEIDTALPDPDSGPKRQAPAVPSAPRLMLDGPPVPEMPPSEGREPGAKRRPPADALAQSSSASSSGLERPPAHAEPQPPQPAVDEYTDSTHSKGVVAKPPINEDRAMAALVAGVVYDQRNVISAQADHIGMLGSGLQSMQQAAVFND